MRNTFPSFSPQPQHVSYHRFNRHYSVISVFQTSPRHRKLVIPVLPKQVSHRIDRWFISSYSPPYLTATQLLSISEFMAYSGVDLHHSDVTPSRAHDAADKPRHVGGSNCQHALFNTNLITRVPPPSGQFFNATFRT